MLICISRNENADLGGEILFPLIQDEEDDLDGMIGELQVELGDMQQRILEDNKRARYLNLYNLVSCVRYHLLLCPVKMYIIATLPFVYFIGQTIDCSKILSMQERRDPVPVRLGIAGN